MKRERKKKEREKYKEANIAMMNQAKEDQGIHQNARERRKRLRIYVSFNDETITIERFDR